MNITPLLSKFTDIDHHYRRPSGFVGQLIGNSMAQQHVAENDWTVSLLKVQPTDTILEVGFGPGIAIQRVAALTTQGHVAGIDFSRTMVAAASRRNKQAMKAGHVSLHYGDVINLPFASQSFDKVFSIHSLYFWPDAQQALKEIQRVLKPGGTLALTILPKEKWPNEGADATLCTVYSADELATVLTRLGFVRIHSERPPATLSVREICVIGTAI